MKLERSRKSASEEPEEDKLQPLTPDVRDRIERRIAEVTARDLGDGWLPIGIIQARITEDMQFCDIRTVMTKGLSSLIIQYYKEQINGTADKGQDAAYHGEISSIITDDDIPF